MADESLQVGRIERATGDELDPKVAFEILRAIGEIRYGSVEVVVHDNRVVQIERKQKIRFASDDISPKR